MVRLLILVSASIAFVSSQVAFASPRGLDMRYGDVQSVIRGDILTVKTDAHEQSFQRWVAGFRAVAARRGISTTTYDRAFKGVKYNADVISKDRNQSEFTKTIWEYLELVASDSRIKNGKKALRKNRKTLTAIEKRYGVDKEVVTAIWGMESAYGKRRGDIPVIEALATLAFDGRRRSFFEQQLVAALKILQAGDVRPKKMTGSWAGAMGHTQFIPTSFLAYAVDGTGDGKRNIWSEDPTDALASTAAYLAKFGWRTGHPWGLEVKLPRDFNYSAAGTGTKKSVATWTSIGVRDMSGRPVADYGSASILLPAGARGAAFMTFHNFHVIERYNKADAYVIGVGHLASRIAGGPDIRASWPVNDRGLTRGERREMQQLLTAKGFDTFGADGLMGPNTEAAIRAFQLDVGMAPDGHATLGVLKRLR